jgi:hypothetical protein
MDKNEPGFRPGTAAKNPKAIVAGEGLLPLLLAKRAVNQGNPLVVYCFGSGERFDGLPGTETIPVTDLSRTGKLTGDARAGSPDALDLQAVLEDMKARGVTSVTLAGTVPKSVMYGASLDPSILRLLEGSNDDHSLLGRIVRAFESIGIPVVPYASHLKDCLAPEGLVAGRAPLAGEAADIEYGRSILVVTLPLSFGQSIVVSGGAVVAIEAMEGTDEMIRRAGEILRGRKNGVLVKMMREDQDIRYDIPVVGTSTLETMKKAGLTCLAVEAGRTLLLEKDEFVRRASELDIAVEGISGGETRIPGGFSS